MFFSVYSLFYSLFAVLFETVVVTHNCYRFSFVFQLRGSRLSAALSFLSGRLSSFRLRRGSVGLFCLVFRGFPAACPWFGADSPYRAGLSACGLGTKGKRRRVRRNFPRSAALVPCMFPVLVITCLYSCVSISVFKCLSKGPSSNSHLAPT